MFFFFSSRRRHTRYIGDWSSDVCSSDLVLLKASAQCRLSFSWAEVKRHCAEAFKSTTPPMDEWELPGSFRLSRSEERRVGKEWSCRVARWDWRRVWVSMRVWTTVLV